MVGHGGRVVVGCGETVSDWGVWGVGGRGFGTYGGFSLQPPSSTASPSAFAASEAAEAVEQGVQGTPLVRPRVCLHLGLTDYKSLITTNLCSDWQSFLAPPLSGSAPAKRLRTCEGSGMGTGADAATGEGESGDGACKGPGMEEGSRQCGAGREAWFSEMAQDGDGDTAAAAATASAAATATTVTVPSAATDSQECPHLKETGDRMAACATCQQAIGQRDAQACQHMGDALGNAALVVTADGCFLLLQRGTAVGEFPNCPVFPGGHPEMFEGMKREVEEENSAPADSLVSSPPHTPHPLLTLSLSLSQSLAPSPLAPASPSSSPSLLNATIAHEMFEGMKGEVEEETGAPANSLVSFPPHTRSHLLSSATCLFFLTHAPHLLRIPIHLALHVPHLVFPLLSAPARHALSWSVQAQGEHAIARHVPLPHCTTHTNGCSCSPPCLPPPFSFSPQHGMLFLGLCRRRENVRSLAMFLCHTSLTAPEVLSCYASAQRKFESTSLRAMPLVRGGMCWYVCAMPPFLCLHLCAAQI
ncbi:unnamed protein product [Closterium sp. NIES-65]|nr:unnamed protein product [Closterium sp. NIES-65]